MKIDRLTIRRLGIGTLAVLITASVFLFVLAPPAPQPIGIRDMDGLAARTVAGAYHVHTTRSDGHGDKAAVAAAAAGAGLKFVILTDHGDGTRPPDPPEYVDGVLMLDCVEISTDQGHYVAIDMPRAPYPLGGTADAVVEDVRRLGGFGIAAHPDSPKPALRWMDATAPIDGIEWINADSEWRDEGRRRLARAGFTYFFRPAASLATLLDRPSTLDRWDGLLRTRRVVALAAADAHGGPGRRVEDANRTIFSIVGIPSYAASFRELSVRAILDAPLSGAAAADARAVFAAIRKGSVFTAIDAIAGPALLDFRLDSSASALIIRIAGPSGGPNPQIVLLGPGGVRAMVSSGDGEMRYELPENAAGPYRVEAGLDGAPGQPPVPWVVSNPIYFSADAAAEGGKTLVAPVVAATTIPPFPWRIERDPSSSGTLRSGAHEVSLEFKLGDGDARTQFVALATDLGAEPLRAIDLSLSADRPHRVSIQLRAAAGPRWGRSYYVDPSGSALHVPVASLSPIGAAAAASTVRDATSLLIVIDRTNAQPGRSGTLRVHSSALIR